MGGAASLGGITNGDTRDRYFCHQCHHLFNLGPGNGLQCPLCDSMFIEEIGPGGRGGPSDMYVSRHGQILTSDQSRRIVNATALLRLLEAQLRDELEFLQRASAQGATQNKKQMTHAMRFKCRTINVTVDQLCSQPSCPVCTNDFEVEKEATRLPCSHLFHQGCVMPWLEMKQNCPICRTEISPDILELEEYQKYSCKELIEKLSILEVEVSDIQEKTSDDLGFLLHKHLKQLETDEKNRELEQEAQRQAEEQQRRAAFERIMAGDREEDHTPGGDHIHSLRRGPRSVTDSGRVFMLDSGSSGGGIGGSGGMGSGAMIFGSMRPIPMMSEFYSSRRLQTRLEEDRAVRIRSEAAELQNLMRRSNSGELQPQFYGRTMIPHFDSEDGDEEPARMLYAPPPGRSRGIAALTAAVDRDEEEEEAEGEGSTGLPTSSRLASERLREIERIEREMEERQRREADEVAREDLAELNEWEASQGLPLTRSFLGSSSSAASSERAMQGYAQSFIARVADSALSARVNSVTTGGGAAGGSGSSARETGSSAVAGGRSTRSMRSTGEEWEPERESLSVRDAITSLRWEVNATVVDSDSD